MRHQKSRLRLPQKPAHARMLQRNLVTSLLLYETVRTTKKRAKVVQPLVDHLVAYTKRKSPQAAIRLINKVVTDKNASRKLMEVYKDRFRDRSSGLTRMIPVGVRIGDGAELVDLQLVVLSTEETDTSDQRKATKLETKNQKLKTSTSKKVTTATGK